MRSHRQLVALASLLALTATPTYGAEPAPTTKPVPAEAQPKELSHRQRKRQEKLARRIARARLDGSLEEPRHD